MSKQLKEESRASLLGRGAKDGALQKSLNQLLNKLAKPMAQGLKPMVQKIHPEVDFNPAMETGLEFATLLAIAEIVQASSTVAYKIPGLDLEQDEAQAKLDALARIIRGKSASHLGEKTGEYAIAFLPIVKQFLGNATQAGIFSKKMKALEPHEPDTILEKLNQTQEK